MLQVETNNYFFLTADRFSMCLGISQPIDIPFRPLDNLNALEGTIA